MPLNLENLLKDSIASPPSLYLKLQKALKDPETTYEEFAAIISADTGFAFRLLKIANSSFYGCQEEIYSITHAVDILGTEAMADLALAALVIEKFKGIPKDLIQMEEFWKHCIACGLAARIIAKFFNETDQERYYLGGLFHDIGSLLLYQEVPEKSRMILAEAGREDKNLFVVENQYFGFDHAKLGGELLRKWQLPEMYAEAAEFHHDPGRAEKFPKMVSIVHLSDIIAHQMELGQSGEPKSPPLIQNGLGLPQLSDDDIDEIKEEIRNNFDQAVNLFLNASSSHTS